MNAVNTLQMWQTIAASRDTYYIYTHSTERSLYNGYHPLAIGAICVRYFIFFPPSTSFSLVLSCLLFGLAVCLTALQTISGVLDLCMNGDGIRWSDCFYFLFLLFTLHTAYTGSQLSMCPDSWGTNMEPAVVPILTHRMHYLLPPRVQCR